MHLEIMRNRWYLSLQLQMRKMIPQTIESEKIIKRFKALKKYFIITTNGPINTTIQYKWCSQQRNQTKACHIWIEYKTDYFTLLLIILFLSYLVIYPPKSSFTHPHAVLNPYLFIFLIGHMRDSFRDALILQFWALLVDHWLFYSFLYTLLLKSLAH